jgi:hypothetical protein
LVALPIDLKDLVEHNKKVVSMEQILLDSMKCHLIPHIARKKTTKDMYDALGTLHKSVNVSKKMILKNKITSTHMRKIDTIASYLMKISKLRNEVATVGDTIEDIKLAQIFLNGFTLP